MFIGFVEASWRMGLALTASCAMSACGAGGAADVEAGSEVHTIEVTFSNVQTETGMIWASLCTRTEYDNLGEAPCGVFGRVDAAEGATLSFDDVPTGTYAISVFHDSNANQRLDFNSRGIPDEPTGNSGNARGFFGPPTFDQMKFSLRDEDAGTPKKISIKLMSIDIP